MIAQFPKFWHFIFGVFFFLFGPTVPCAGKNIQMANFIKQFCWRLEQEAVQTQFSFAVFALLILLWSFPISQIFESHFWWVFAIWSNCAALVPAGGGGSGGGVFLLSLETASCFLFNPLLLSQPTQKKASNETAALGNCLRNRHHCRTMAGIS